jgi:hypothetical protein
VLDHTTYAAKGELDTSAQLYRLALARQPRLTIPGARSVHQFLAHHFMVQEFAQGEVRDGTLATPASY